MGKHAAVKAANAFMFQFHLLEHEIHFPANKSDLCFEVGENKALPSIGRATLTVSCSHVHKSHSYALLNKIIRNVF